MKPGVAFAVSAVALCAMQVSATETANASLCRAGEHQYFSCHIQGSAKVASLCGNVDLSSLDRTTIFNERDTAYLQYRFGTPINIEMMYPKQGRNSFKKFGGSNIRNYFGALQEVTFSVGKYRYSVSSEAFAQDDVRNDIKEFYGIRVWESMSLTPKEFNCATSPFADPSRSRDTWGDFDKITEQLSELNRR